MFDTKPYEDKMTSVFDHFKEELKKIRTGRAHPSMLDSVTVEVYSTKLPLNQVANVTAPEAQLLQVTPFDPGTIQAIVAAVRANQSLGLNPSDDGRIIRIPVPPLTEERRKLLVKQTNDKVEETRIALRTIRQDALKDAKRKKDARELSEDDLKVVAKDVDKSMGEFQDKIDVAFKQKEKDILTI